MDMDEIFVVVNAANIHSPQKENWKVGRNDANVEATFQENDAKALHSSQSQSCGSTSICSCDGTSNHQSDTKVKAETGSNFSCRVEDDADNTQITSYFDFLDDYIRFDVSRIGVSCFSGYSISVQYEDDYIVGKAGTQCCSFVWRTKSRIRLWHGVKAFEMEYLPRVSCITPKNCAYRVKISNEKNEIGTIHFRENLVHIYNTYEKCLSLRWKQGSNRYSIKTEGGERLASVEIFRGFRGDIMNYGLSILGDVSSTDKALLIALTVAMDIRQRESEMRCSLLWVPLFCVAVIGLFSILPWLYFHDSV